MNLAFAAEAVPLSARLMAVAGAHDALISRRVYKAPMSHEQAAAIIVAGRGRDFEPDVTEVFITLVAQFRQISTRFDDRDKPFVKLEPCAKSATLGEP